MLTPHLKYLPMPQLDGECAEWQQTVFLRHFITKPFIEVGDYTYYDASFSNENPADFENTNVLYYGTEQKLKIGKFCCLANKCKFVMSGANHHVNAFTTYPLFWNFANKPGVKSYFDIIPDAKHYKHYGDTVIGNDVWIGYDALIMPGVRIGDGAIIGARAVAAKDVPPYTVVAGNPAKKIRQRFDDATIEALLKMQWWNWDMGKIMRNYDALMNCDLVALEGAL